MTEQERKIGPRPWPREVARTLEALGLAVLTVATLPTTGCKEEGRGSGDKRFSAKDLGAANTAMNNYRAFVDSLAVRGILSPEQARGYADITIGELVRFSPGVGLILNMENSKVDEVYTLKNASDPSWLTLFAEKGIVASAEVGLAQLADRSTTLKARIELARKWANTVAAQRTP